MKEIGKIEKIGKTGFPRLHGFPDFPRLHVIARSVTNILNTEKNSIKALKTINFFINPN